MFLSKKSFLPTPMSQSISLCLLIMVLQFGVLHLRI
jgi:hypothetical protein